MYNLFVNLTPTVPLLAGKHCDDLTNGDEATTLG